MINFVSGDIFETPADIRVNTVNCVGVMGAGVALAFKTKYPEMFREYRTECRKGNVKPGKLHVWEKIGDHIINLPTKRHWRQPSRLEDIEAGLSALREYLAEKGKVKVALPALGCGHGGLDWNVVSGKIKNYLSDLEAEIIVFEPSASHAAGRKTDENTLKKLRDLGILVVDPSHDKYPPQFKGTSATTFYIKGRADIFESGLLAVLPSAKPSPRETEATKLCVEAIARPGVTFFTGYGPDIERPVLRIALEKGADAAILLAEGILNFRVRKDLADVWDENRVTVISAFPPNRKWNPSLAAKAGEIKHVLSKAALITDPSPQWLLKMINKKPVSDSPGLFHIHYQTDSPGMKDRLIKCGSRSVGRHKATGKPNVDPILHCLNMKTDSENQETVKYMIENSNASPIGKVAEPLSDRTLSETNNKDHRVSGNTWGYHKRLIEVDLPIKKLSKLKSRPVPDKHLNVRKTGPWWSRKPQNQARGLWLAITLPDPTDPHIQDVVIEGIRKSLQATGLLSQGGASSRQGLQKDLVRLCVAVADPSNLDDAILWRATREILKKVKALDQVVLDPFAGSGSYPVEASRIGFKTIANDYNPISGLILRAALELGRMINSTTMRNQIIHQLDQVVRSAREQVSKYYPSHPSFGDPIGYLHFRQLRCEAPACGRIVPATSKFVLSKKDRIGVRISTAKKPGESVELELVSDIPLSSFPSPTMKQGSLICPVCEYVTKRASICKQRNREAFDPIVVAIVYRVDGKYIYENPTAEQVDAIAIAGNDSPKYIPAQKWPLTELRRFSPPLYGYIQFADCHTVRQSHYLSELVCGVRDIFHDDYMVKKALKILGALIIGNEVNEHTAFCRWRNDRGGDFEFTFSGKSIGMIWDFFEMNPLYSNNDGKTTLANIAEIFQAGALLSGPADVLVSPAQEIPLPDNSIDTIYTDPPYYDAIPYSHLSDWMFVWITGTEIEMDSIGKLAPKEKEIVVDRQHSRSPSIHDSIYYHREMHNAFEKCRAVLKPSGIGLVVFAHQSTNAWESLLEALIEADFIVTASWPIETERGGRLQAQGTASLQSSIHLVIRPREKFIESHIMHKIGDWRDVLAELPIRVHEWMPRLAQEGIVGADAIFACLGPALEIYSRYSSVEKAGGEKVELKEYLEEVWAAVSREALNMIFEGADATGFEEDARLTAMWLWTLKTAANGDDDSDDADSSGKGLRGYSLEYDAARKIAQGLGAHLETLSHLVEIKGSTATLLTAAARTRYLFGKDAGEAPKGKRKKKATGQLSLFEIEKDIRQIGEQSDGWAEELTGRAGSTVLDQLHQSMILFAAGRGEGMKRFLVEEGVGRNPLFWRLAQAFSALYPAGTDEKRWVDGVLARKKGLGL